LNGTACTPLPLLAAGNGSVVGRRPRRGDACSPSRAQGHGRPPAGRFPGYYRPPCGFFLWLKVDDGVALTQRLWADFALKALPGAYLTQPDAQGSNAGVEFVRIALVHDPETTREGLTRLSNALRVTPGSAMGDEAVAPPLAKRRKWA
jgi:hypothetical protein